MSRYNKYWKKHGKVMDKIANEAIDKLDTQCLIDLKNILIGAIRNRKAMEKMREAKR